MLLKYDLYYIFFKSPYFYAFYSFYVFFKSFKEIKILISIYIGFNIYKVKNI